MASSNPFVFQRPVDDLIDREAELARLLDLAAGAHFMRLSAPRRYGKTTLIRRLRIEAEEQLEMTTIVVDFSRVLSLGDVTVRIEDAYRRATDGPVRRAVRTLMRSWNLGVSLGRVAQGLVLGVGLGVLVGCISGMSRLGDDLVDPVVQMFRTVPFVALTSLFILWFGIGERPKYLLVALGCFFPVYLNTFNGIRNVDARLVEAAKGFGLKRLGLVREVILPGALPQALLGLRYALGISWLALVIAEQINANSGIGYLLTTAQNNLDTAGVIASIVTYAALGVITDALVRVLESRLLAWRRGYTGA